MATFLVTGGCGFIGSHLVERLLGKGHQVRVIDNLSTGRRDNIPAQVELIVGDVADRAVVQAGVAGVAGCFHLAAVASVQQSIADWLGTHRTNLSGTITVLDAARNRPRRPLPVVYASSAAVYGDSPLMPLDETSPTRPLTAYGADKLGCELHARVATLVHGIPTTGFRFFNVFGPRQDPRSPYSGVISIFASRLLADQPLTIFGDGAQTRDFVYVGDVVDHLCAAMASPGRTARVFNVCTGRPTSILELAEIMGGLLGTRPQIQCQPARPGDITTSLGSPRLARRRLGVAATTPLADGLRRTLAYLRDGTPADEAIHAPSWTPPAQTGAPSHRPI